MKKLYSYTLFLAIAVQLSGCGGVAMKPAGTNEVTPPSEGMAKVVFMRKSFVGSAINAEILDVTDGKLKLIGGLSSGYKIAYETTPGKKVFMAYGTAADFMLADLRAGKIYYSIVRPNWGTGGFAPTPIREFDTEEFKGWFEGTELVVPALDTDAWMKEHQEEYEALYKDYWARFQNKTEVEKQQRTLLPAYGR